MRFPVQFLLTAALAAVMAPAMATDIPAARDLAADGARAQARGTPLLLFFHSRSCGYCRQVEELYLRNLDRDPKYGGRVLLRSIDVDSHVGLRDFGGADTTPAAYAGRMRVPVVPVVLLVDGAGQTLAPPLVGAGNPDFYLGYFEAALDGALAELGARGLRLGRPGTGRCASEVC